MNSTLNWRRTATIVTCLLALAVGLEMQSVWSREPSSVNVDCDGPYSRSWCHDGRPNCDTACLWDITKGGSLPANGNCKQHIFPDEVNTCEDPGTPVTQYSVCDQIGVGPVTWALACCDNRGKCLERCPPDPGDGGGGDECFGDGPQECGFNASDPLCYCETPIFLNTRGNRLSLTDRAGGVRFDLNADGILEQIPWSRAGSKTGMLVMDRNANGLIDDGTELFSNYSPQAPTEQGRDGFNAMRFLDAALNGGNDDGFLTANDWGFHELQLWIDSNHDGLSQSSELHSLGEAGIESFDLAYWESKRRDPNGNLFRYTARVMMRSSSHGPTFAVDVFFPRP